MPIPLGILAVAGAGAAGGAGAFDLLETTVLGSDTASVTFSSLGSYSAYKHLQIRAASRSTRASATIDNLFIRLNSDSGSNYQVHGLIGNGSSVSSFAEGSTSIGVLRVPAADSTADAFGAGIIEILDFSSSNKNTTIRSLNGTQTATTQIALSSGLWVNTAAVTTILIGSATGSIRAGSRFSLYGIK